MFVVVFLASSSTLICLKRHKLPGIAHCSAVCVQKQLESGYPLKERPRVEPLRAPFIGALICLSIHSSDRVPAAECCRFHPTVRRFTSVYFLSLPPFTVGSILVSSPPSPTLPRKHLTASHLQAFQFVILNSSNAGT